MDDSKYNKLAYLEGEEEVRWFLDHIPEVVKTELQKLNVKIDITGRIVAPVRMGCPFGYILPCAQTGGEKVYPPPYSNFLQIGPLK